MTDPITSAANEPGRPVPAAGATEWSAEGAAPTPAVAPAASGSGRRRGRVIAAITIPLAVLALIAGGALLALHLVAEHERALAARIVSTEQQAAVDEAFVAVEETAAQIRAQRESYAAARTLWDATAAAVVTWKADATAPAPPMPNPGGSSIPGGDAQARALLDGIGGSAVQISYDAGPQNCGYALAAQTYGLSLGGCYDSNFRNTVFLAWDPGVDRDAVWAIFVHEAMHWYQWDRHAQLFTLATEQGLGEEAYRAQIESDASCRAVHQHGVPASAFAATSAPCDVAGWHDAWLVEQFAALGVPTAEPVVDAYEVREAVRP